jgi:hypothetical protein
MYCRFHWCTQVKHLGGSSGFSKGDSSWRYSLNLLVQSLWCLKTTKRGGGHLSNYIFINNAFENFPVGVVFYLHLIPCHLCPFPNICRFLKNKELKHFSYLFFYLHFCFIFTYVDVVLTTTIQHVHRWPATKKSF